METQRNQERLNFELAIENIKNKFDVSYIVTSSGLSRKLINLLKASIVTHFKSNHVSKLLTIQIIEEAQHLTNEDIAEFTQQKGIEVQLLRLQLEEK